jgi:arylsulfatase A-like enzyme
LPITELEWNRSNWAELDFCSTVQDFAARLRTRRSKKPVFFFTQPTNIHRVALMRLKDRGPKRSYGEFNSGYSSELERLDHCFGTFLATLKQHDLYANSIIVVTSDHGDAMGDNGRHGHSAKIYPEMLRVPLLIHIPESLQPVLQADVDRVALITDIAPTIHYVLGHRALANRQIAGRPLLTRSLTEQQPYLRDAYLVSADSAPVHGILADNGTRLYILDEVEGEDYFFDLRNDPGAVNNIVDDEARRKYRPLIREHLQQIADFYAFRPDPQGIAGWLSR